MIKCTHWYSLQHLPCPASRLGHDTRHFNVGAYRRTQKGADDVQDASFFDHANEVWALAL